MVETHDLTALSQDGRAVDCNVARFPLWPGSWRTDAPLLERAVEQCSRSRTPTHIVDRRRDYSLYPAVEGRALQLPGGLRKSAHSGRVLRVS